MLRKIPRTIIIILQGIVQASFSQGHEKFGVTQGIQCICICLYSVCFSSFKHIFEWPSEDLEYVIVKGDQLLILLSCVDLPRTAEIENVKVTVTFLANIFVFFY